jgi:hypothetical protein
MTFSLDCPTATNTDNDACRAQSIYPAEVWHTQGSVWGGTTTARLDDSTTAWYCNLGSCGGPGCNTVTGGPHCIKSITAKGRGTTVETTQLDSCYIRGHTVPLLVTGGADKLNSEWYKTQDVEQIHSIYSSLLSSLGCPALTTTTSSAGASVIGSTISSGATPTQSQASSTSAQSHVLGSGSSSTVPSPASSAKSGSSCSFREIPGLSVFGAIVLLSCSIILHM